MGLPPSLCVSLNDNMLDRFNLLDPVIVPIQSELTALRDEVGLVNERLLTMVKSQEVDGQIVNTLEWNDEVDRNLRQIRLRLARVRQLREQLLKNQMTRAETDI